MAHLTTGPRSVSFLELSNDNDKPEIAICPHPIVSFTNQTTDTGIISREDNEEQILGSIDYYAFLLLRTEENARRLLGTDTTGNYQRQYTIF